MCYSQVKTSSNMQKRASNITDQASNLLTEEGNIRVLRVRNPWGKKEWQGQFGDKSDVWTQRLRKLLDRGNSLAAVLCCAVRCCGVACCGVLCCAVLCCAVLCCAVLCCAVLCCAVLFCAVLYCTVLPCASLLLLFFLIIYISPSLHIRTISSSPLIFLPLYLITSTNLALTFYLFESLCSYLFFLSVRF